jgi:glycosyltransferase involved in cell wall biosynthesis
MSEPVLISVIITVRNESKHMADLLDSLVTQERPFEIIVVDAWSDDNTYEIVEDYEKRYPEVKLYRKGGTRGQGRNFGVEQCTGDAVAFIDGDCIANPFWLAEMRKGLEKEDVVAGKTINLGYEPFVELGRVELYHKGFDLTYPSCNLTYRRGLFDKIGEFDDWFMTAEDIDLNYRAVEAGGGIIYMENAIVYHRARSTFFGFFKQAFWNGYGRKQLTLKHGRLWNKYNPTMMISQHRMTLWYFIRMGLALLGYLICKAKEDKPEKYGAAAGKKKKK